MELKKVDASGAWVVLSPDDLLTVCNALNEVCNGIDVPEFAMRMGVTREEALHREKYNFAIDRTMGMRMGVTREEALHPVGQRHGCRVASPDAHGSDARRSIAPAESRQCHL